MKIKLVTDCPLPGGFLIEAETPEEALIIRMFCDNGPNLIIANFGGNINENRNSMLIMQDRATVNKKIK